MNEGLDMETLLDEIKECEQRLTDLRKEYRERKTAGLRDAIAARNEADKAVQEELKALAPVKKDIKKGSVKTG